MLSEIRHILIPSAVANVSTVLVYLCLPLMVVPNVQQHVIDPVMLHRYRLSMWWLPIPVMIAVRSWEVEIVNERVIYVSTIRVLVIILLVVLIVRTCGFISYIITVCWICIVVFILWCCWLNRSGDTCVVVSASELVLVASIISNIG